LDHAPPAPWPEWLLKLTLPPLPKAAERHRAAPRSADALITGILRTVSTAREGQRNSMLNWAAFRLGERVVAGEIARAEAATLLAEAAIAAGLLRTEAIATIHSGLKGRGRMSGDDAQWWTQYGTTEVPIIMPPPSEEWQRAHGWKDGKPPPNGNGGDHGARIGGLRVLSVDDLMVLPPRDYLAESGAKQPVIPIQTSH
jgi:hypothetical protein